MAEDVVTRGGMEEAVGIEGKWARVYVAAGAGAGLRRG